MDATVVSGHASLHVEEHGRPAAPALVCLHAGVTDRRMWAPQVEALQATHRVIAYDRRGFGLTRTLAEPFTHVGDLIALLDACAIDSAVLMGCSQGGRIAIDAALAHPQRVRALVLVACAISGAPEPASFPAATQATIEALQAASGRKDLRTINELEARLWLDGPEEPVGRVGGALRELFLEMNAIALGHGEAHDETAPPAAWERLGELRLPVLVVWGSLDFESTREQMQHVARTIPGVRSLVIDDAAHLPGLEQPEPFNRGVASFLASLAPVGSPPRPTSG